MKKSVVVEAVQWFKPGDHPAVGTATDTGMITLEPAPGVDPEDVTLTGFTGYIDMPEGRLKVEAGDWIITGVAGENYPCKPDTFVQLYTPAD